MNTNDIVSTFNYRTLPSGIHIFLKYQKDIGTHHVYSKKCIWITTATHDGCLSIVHSLCPDRNLY